MTEFDKLPIEEQIRYLAKNNNSKRGAAEILGIGVDKFYTMLKAMPPLPWCSPYESVQYRQKVESADYHTPAHVAARLKSRESYRRNQPKIEFCGVVATKTEIWELWKDLAVSRELFYQRLRSGLPIINALFDTPMDKSQAGKLNRKNRLHPWNAPIVTKRGPRRADGVHRENGSIMVTFCGKTLTVYSMHKLWEPEGCVSHSTFRKRIKAKVPPLQALFAPVDTKKQSGRKRKSTSAGWNTIKKERYDGRNQTARMG